MQMNARSPDAMPNALATRSRIEDYAYYTTTAVGTYFLRRIASSIHRKKHPKYFEVLRELNPEIVLFILRVLVISPPPENT